LRSQSSDKFPQASIGGPGNFGWRYLGARDAVYEILGKHREPQNLCFCIWRNLVVSDSELPALQIFANLFLAESRKIKGLQAKKFGFSESRAAMFGFRPG
jgi:hypothetical protein